MKKMLILFTLLYCNISAFSQTAYTESLLQQIKDEWKIDDNGNLTYTKIIDSLNMDKNSIYQRAINYFIYNYSSANAVIQSQDKEAGIIVGKGNYPNVHIGVNIVSTITVNTWHILRVDIKDGRCRVILTLTNYDKIINSGRNGIATTSPRIIDEYPINPDGANKNIMGKAFFHSHEAAMKTFASFEKAIREGSTSKVTENGGW